jgi:hypothetical protein
VIGSPVDSANGSANYNCGRAARGSFVDDDESAPIDSRNVSGSDDGASFCENESQNDNQEDDSDDPDDGCDLCTRDEDLSVPGDGGSSHMDDDSRSLTPSSDESWGCARPVVPPLDLR